MLRSRVLQMWLNPLFVKFESGKLSKAIHTDWTFQPALPGQADLNTDRSLQFLHCWLDSKRHIGRYNSVFSLLLWHSDGHRSKNKCSVVLHTLTSHLVHFLLSSSIYSWGQSSRDKLITNSFQINTCSHMYKWPQTCNPPTSASLVPTKYF